MSALESFITEYLSKTAGTYFVRQIAVIFTVFLFGAILTDALAKKGMSVIKRCIIAFPVGLGAFTITAYAMLVIGVPYNPVTVICVVVLEAAAAITVKRSAFSEYAKTPAFKHMICAAAIVIAVAAVATSGLAPVVITNDTMYYFKRYPESIVYYGGLRDQFDAFLTDTGLGSVCIDTLPALFGFGETFGIREFFNIDFSVFFAVCVYERSRKYLQKKNSIIASIIATAFLVMSTPFAILSHWALANMYFMELFFIVAYTFFDEDSDRPYTGFIMMLALSLLRIEGTMFVLWLALCIALKKEISKRLALFVMLPMAILFGGYSLVIFTRFYLFDNIYLFLTPAKAAFLTGAIVAVGIYLYFIRPRIPEKYERLLPFGYIVALVGGNAVLMCANTQRYIGNLNVFAANLFRQSGWGIFPYFVIAMSVLLAVEYGISYKKQKGAVQMDASSMFDITLVIGYILIVFAVSYGRGDSLTEYLGDSGNRVLLQVVPLIVMTFAGLFTKLSQILLALTLDEC